MQNNVHWKEMHQWFAVQCHWTELNDFLHMFPLLLMTLHAAVALPRGTANAAEKNGGLGMLFCTFAPFKSPSVPPWEKRKMCGDGDASHMWLNAVILSYCTPLSSHKLTWMPARAIFRRPPCDFVAWVLSYGLFIYMHFWLSGGIEVILALTLRFVPVPTLWRVQVLLHSTAWWQKAVLRVFD